GVAGRDRMSIMNFVGCPSRGVIHWNDGRPTSYRFPPPGQPVLALTDLGLFQACGRRISLFEWTEFESQLRRRRSPLIILFPGAAHRLPKEVVSRLRVLPLDRGTGVRGVVGGHESLLASLE